MNKLSLLPKYDAYKSSDVEWFGDIPTHWKEKPIVSLTEVKSVTNKSDEELLSVYLNLGVIRFSDISEKRTNVTSQDLSKYQLVEPGDFVMNNQQAWRGSVGVSKFTGIVSPAYIILKLSKRLDSIFANYLFRDSTMVSQYLINSKGVGTIQRNLYWPQMKRATVLLPPFEEQIAIAKFLDEKTAKIDQAIAIKEKQIELLKERKQILIQNAVTRGLDPNVPMKDSGIEWIGEIPEHWEVKRLRFVVKILKRIIGFEGPDVLSITQKGITVKDITSGEGQLAMNYSKYQIINKGEFGMNHMDLLTGYVDISKYEGVISPDYRVFVNCDKKITDTYLLSIFKLGYKQRVFYRYGQGVSLLGRWRFPADNFKNFFIPIPSVKEQKEIVDFLDKENKLIEKGITHQVNQIKKLKEYKSTLVNSAVTGKIKVV